MPAKKLPNLPTYKMIDQYIKAKFQHYTACRLVVEKYGLNITPTALQKYYNIYKQYTAMPESREKPILHAQLFPEWVQGDSPEVFYQPDSVFYHGVFPDGMWVERETPYKTAHAKRQDLLYDLAIEAGADHQALSIDTHALITRQKLEAYQELEVTIIRLEKFLEDKLATDDLSYINNSLTAVYDKLMEL